MARKVGNSMIDRMRMRVEAFNKRAKRKLGPEAVGSPGDIRDRFRDVYQPGAREAPRPGLRNPLESIRALRRRRVPR